MMEKSSAEQRLEKALGDMEKAKDNINEKAKAEREIKVEDESEVSQEIPVAISNSSEAPMSASLAQKVNNLAKKKPATQPTAKELANLAIELGDEQLVSKLATFIKKKHCAITYNAGTPAQKIHITAPAWDYLARLKRCRVNVGECEEATHPYDSRIRVVRCDADLMDDRGRVLSSATAVAETDELFLKNKQMNAAYGLAQTRAKCRAIQNAFGSYMTEAGYEMTPAEEIYNENIDLEAI